jgi:hypothetical protein
MVRFISSLRRNKKRVNSIIVNIIQLAYFTKINLANQKSKDFIRLWMVLFNIDVTTEKYNILKRNDLIYYFTFILYFEFCHIYKWIYFLFLSYSLCTLPNLDCCCFKGNLNNLISFNEDLPVIVWSLYTILLH